MICKECGAYNPDHATYCKVCAANLKEDSAPAGAKDGESRATRTFVRPSWTVPTYQKSSRTAEEEQVHVSESEDEPEEVIEMEPEPAEEEPVEEKDASVDFFDEEEDEEPEPPKPVRRAAKPVVIEEEDEDDEDDEEEEEVRVAPKFGRRAPKASARKMDFEDDDDDEEEPKIGRHAAKKPAHKSEPEEDDDDDDEEEEDVPAYHRSERRTKRQPVRLEHEDEDDEDEFNSDQDEDDDSYEYEPTPPKRKKNGKGNGPLFWILLVAIIVVIICIIVAGVMLLTKGENGLSCGAAETTVQQNDNRQPGLDTKQGSNDQNQQNGNDLNTVTVENTTNDKGQECFTMTIPATAHSIVTIQFPSMDDQVNPNDSDNAIFFKLTVPKAIYYPDAPVDNPQYSFTPQIFRTESDGTTHQLIVPQQTVTLPTLTIDLEQPTPNEEGIIMADKNNNVHISGHVNDDSPYIKLTIDGQESLVYTGGFFETDYTMTSATPVSVTISVEEKNWASATKEITINPYVFTPEKMVLTVDNDRMTELKAGKAGTITVRGKTLPGATLTAVSDDTTQVVCSSVTVDGEGNYTFGITMDVKFYGTAMITLNAEKEDAESGSTQFYVYRMYDDRKAFNKGYGSNYKEVGTGSKNLTISAMLAQQSTYATNNYGFRITAKVDSVTKGEDGYTYVQMTLVSGETVYVINFSDKWDPATNVGSKYNIYGNFLGTYTDGTTPLFAGFFAMKK